MMERERTGGWSANYHHLCCHLVIIHSDSLITIITQLSIVVRIRPCSASPLRNFFKESLTRGPLRLCVNEKTVRVNDSPYFQFKGHTVPLAPIPIKIIIKIIKIKNRNAALSDKVSD